jgi:hypothetical protein
LDDIEIIKEAIGKGVSITDEQFLKQQSND